MSRLHVRRMEVVSERSDSGWHLRCPAVGFFRPSRNTGDFHPGQSIGTLTVLGASIELVIPAGVHGWIGNLVEVERQNGLVPHFARYNDPLATLSPHPILGGSDQRDEETAAPAEITGAVFRAPTSGRYYGRPSPDKPPFVVAGAEIDRGATVCLLEVMKTFNRVTYDGERARVRELLVAEGADVNAGDPLLALDLI